MKFFSYICNRVALDTGMCGRRVGSYDLFFLTRTVTFVVLNSTKFEVKAIVTSKRHLDDINQTK